MSRTTQVVLWLAAVQIVCTLAVQAAEWPPFWVAVSVGDSQLDAGPQAKPPAATAEPVATVKAGETVTLRAKVVGGRRAYMMWPEQYANVGANTTILVRGFDRLEYQVQTTGYLASASWTVSEEKYSWDTGKQGALYSIDQNSERVSWTAPTREGVYRITVSGQVKFHSVRNLPGGIVEGDEDSGKVSRTISIAVKKKDEEATETMTDTEALKHILNRFNALGSGPLRDGGDPVVLPILGPVGPILEPGSSTNIRSIFNSSYREFVCGGWQSKVLDMLDSMRNGSETEQQIFEHYDYGPIHAYYGGHQAVVIYPKGTNWKVTGTVLDPWPKQRPETFSVPEWNRRFWFGQGPSTVYEGQYPLTGGADYPKPLLRIPPSHMAILKRLAPEQRRQYTQLTDQRARDDFINSLPPSDTETTAVVVHSPVQMIVADETGRRVGWVDEQTFVYEIPGVDVDCFPEGDDDHGMMLLLPQGRYSVQITGVRAGSFGFTRVVAPTTSSTPLSQKLDIPVQPGQKYTCVLTPGAEMPLTGPDDLPITLEKLPITGDAGGGGAAGVAREDAAPVRTLLDATGLSYSDAGDGRFSVLSDNDITLYFGQSEDSLHIHTPLETMPADARDQALWALTALRMNNSDVFGRLSICQQADGASELYWSARLPLSAVSGPYATVLARNGALQPPRWQAIRAGQKSDSLPEMVPQGDKDALTAQLKSQLRDAGLTFDERGDLVWISHDNDVLVFMTVQEGTAWALAYFGGMPGDSVEEQGAIAMDLLRRNWDYPMGRFSLDHDFDLLWECRIPMDYLTPDLLRHISDTAAAAVGTATAQFGDRPFNR